MRQLWLVGCVARALPPHPPCYRDVASSGRAGYHPPIPNIPQSPIPILFIILSKYSGSYSHSRTLFGPSSLHALALALFNLVVSLLVSLFLGATRSIPTALYSLSVPPPPIPIPFLPMDQVQGSTPQGGFIACSPSHLFQLNVTFISIPHSSRILGPTPRPIPPFRPTNIWCCLKNANTRGVPCLFQISFFHIY